jgi:hypothetical protein
MSSNIFTLMTSAKLHTKHTASIHEYMLLLLLTATAAAAKAHLDRLTSSWLAPSTSFRMSLILIVMLSLSCGEFNTCAKYYNVSFLFLNAKCSAVAAPAPASSTSRP